MEVSRRVEVTHQAEVDILRAVDTHPEVVVTHQEVTAQEVQDTNKFRLVINLTKELMLTHNCCTKSRKSCCNKRT
jgi:hypothetical protein